MRKRVIWNTVTWSNPREYGLMFDYINHEPMSWDEYLDLMEIFINEGR